MGELFGAADAERRLAQMLEAEREHKASISRRRIAEFVGIMVDYHVAQTPMYTVQHTRVDERIRLFRRNVPAHDISRYSFVTSGWLMTEKDIPYEDRPTGLLVTPERQVYQTSGITRVDPTDQHANAPADLFVVTGLPLKDIGDYVASNDIGLTALTHATQRLAPQAL